MLWPKKNSFKEFDNVKKFLRRENSPPPLHPPPSPINFLMVRPLHHVKTATVFLFVLMLLLLLLFSISLKLQNVKDKYNVFCCKSKESSM